MSVVNSVTRYESFGSGKHTFCVLIKNRQLNLKPKQVPKACSNIIVTCAARIVNVGENKPGEKICKEPM